VGSTDCGEVLPGDTVSMMLVDACLGLVPTTMAGEKLWPGGFK
jgi:hypothetical protein